MSSTDISMPVIKAGTAITAAVVAKADVAESVALAVTQNVSYDMWFFVNSVPWSNIASFVAVLYTVLLLCEWWWKKLWRPMAERWGWIKERKRYILTAEEYKREQEQNGVGL